MTRKILLLLVAAAYLGAACGNPGRSFDVGLQRVALDLAFKTDSPATEVKPELAFEPVPVESQARLTLSYPGLKDGDLDANPRPIVFRETCPTAPADAVPPDIATRSITTEVPTGRYFYRDEGQFEITGPLPVKGALPPFSVRDYTDARTIPQAPTWTLRGQPVPVPTQVTPPDHYAWTIVQPLGADNYIKRMFEASDVALLLTKLVYKVGDTVVEFNPNPPIRMMDLGTDGGEGATWDSAGTDPATGASMLVRGGIERRELVDVCGTPYEAWKIRSTELITGLAGPVPFSSQTDDAQHPPYFPDKPPSNFYWVATQRGGQFIKEETHTTTTIGTVVISIDGVSTQMNLDPRPLPKS